jgi:5'-nucleotidase
MHDGKDGFGALSAAEGAESIVDDENGTLISVILRQFFLSLKVVGKWSRGSFNSKFFGALKNNMKAKGDITQSEEAARHEELDDDDQDSGSEDENDGVENAANGEDRTREEKTHVLINKFGTRWARLAGVRQKVDWTSAISPSIEGRILEVKKE